MPQYQTFEDTTGHSDSAAKLACLRLPERLDGMSVLDVACNEGYFCQAAWKRGASRVVGIDKDASFIERARQRDARTDYREMDWSQMAGLGETFDIVLLLSALHYADDPAELLGLALERVAPDGMLVLECGVAPGRTPEWVPVSRARGDTVLHPTLSMLMKAVPGTVVRRLGDSVDQVGDPIPRAVFRITRLKPVVLLVEGPSGVGKSTLTRILQSSGNAAISLDHMLVTLREWCEDPALLGLFEGEVEIDSTRLGQLGERIATARAEEAFVDAVIANRAPLDHALTVVDGYLLGTGEVAALFASRLAADGAFVWHVEPSEARPRLFGGTRPAGRRPERQASRFVHRHEAHHERSYAPSFYASGWINRTHAEIAEVVKTIEGKLAVEDHLKLYEAGYFARGAILEVGRFCGRSTAILALAARDAGHGHPIYSIDYSPKNLSIAQENLRRFGVLEATTLIQGNSAVQISRVPGPVDTVFLDGDHSYEGVLSDLNALGPLLRGGSVVLFHDYYHAANETGQYGVARAVAAVGPEMGLEFRGRFGAIALYERR